MGLVDFLHRPWARTLAGFLEAVQEAVLIASAERRLVYANRAALDLLGYSLEELQAKETLDWVALPYRKGLARAMWPGSPAQPGTLELAFVQKDGSWRYARCSFLYLEMEGQMYSATIAQNIAQPCQTRQSLTDADVPYVAQNAIEAERLASKRLEALYQADEKLYASLELDQVLQALADVCVDLLGADKSCILTWDETHQLLMTRAQRGFTSQFVQLINEYAGHGLIVYAARGGETVVVQDTHQDGSVVRQITDPEGIRAFMHIPIRLEGQVFGVFSVNNLQPHTFGPEEQRVFTSLARRAALAIQNARLYAQAQGKAVLEERQKLARDLHDSVSQTIYGIVLGVRSAKAQLAQHPEQVPATLDFVLKLAEAATAEMRALIFELRPDSLKHQGLVAALARQVAATRARHGLYIETRLGSEPPLSLEAKEALYRVAQEALHNVVQHAQAHKVYLRLEQHDSKVELEVRDDGVGFDSQREYPGHLGLVSMRERIERLGGRFYIASSPGAGTTLRAELNLPSS
ncbi:GAF domain-containing protein [Meiothermus cerbereus]|uniref:GAF domain-containing protein n=1 Tax=Meiothermus cerbereus TaxID=65552 RepID=UPI002FDA38CB